VGQDADGEIIIGRIVLPGVAVLPPGAFGQRQVGRGAWGRRLTGSGSLLRQATASSRRAQGNSINWRISGSYMVIASDKGYPKIQRAGTYPKYYLAMCLKVTEEHMDLIRYKRYGKAGSTGAYSTRPNEAARSTGKHVCMVNRKKRSRRLNVSSKRRLRYDRKNARCTGVTHRCARTSHSPR
jgi:hypothetical protein